jgi:hypothetical protein
MSGQQGRQAALAAMGVKLGHGPRPAQGGWGVGWRDGSKLRDRAARGLDDQNRIAEVLVLSGGDGAGGIIVR